MSGRSIADVERSLEAHRRELSAAIDDLRRGVDQGAHQLEDVKQDVKQLPTAARARLEQEVAARRGQLAKEVTARSDQLAVGAAGAGFVVGGGARGVVKLPLKFIGISRSRSEIVVRQDRHSRQVGRALAAVAASDRQLRGRREFPSRKLRRLALVAPVAAGIAALVSGERNLPPMVIEQREKLLDALFT